MPGSAGELRRCDWCGREFSRRSHRGPVPRFCSGSCRSREYAWRDLRRALRPHVREGHLAEACRVVWSRARLGAGIPQYRLDRGDGDP